MIRIGIYGYGNLGRGVEAAIANNEDMKLVGVFTRRNPKELKIKTKGALVLSCDDAINYKNEIDVMILCGGSASDLPFQTPMLAEHFNVVDSFDTHANIPTHFANVDKMALKGNKTALISTGWDPGMFSLNRVIMESILPNGNSYTFWGRGVSQGHSDAIRRIDGVIDARQYTVPVDKALDRVRNGENPILTTREKHTRECYVVVKDGYDKKMIEKQIKEMPNYFSDYDTTVSFISKEELDKNHSKIPHGGCVIRTGKTGLDQENIHVVEYNLKLDSNPEFTGSILTTYARAVYNLSKRNDFGCKTVFDIAPRDLSNKSYEELLKKSL